MKNCSEMNEMISLHIDNELGADERREFEKHLNSCQSCKKELDDIMQIIKLCRDTEEEELPQDFTTELHRKLLDVKEQESGKLKTSMLRTRYVKIISSVAAGILLIFLAKGIYDVGIFAPHSSTRSTNDKMMKSQASPVEQTNAAAAVQSGGSGVIARFNGGTANAADSSAGSVGSAGVVGSMSSVGSVDFGLAQSADSAGSAQSTRSEEPAGSAEITAAENKSEINRSAANKNRDIQAPMLASAFIAEKASSNSVTLTILVDDPTVQADKIRTVAVDNGGEEKKDNGLKLSIEATDQTDKDKDEIIIGFLLPNIQYDKFAGSLNTIYGQSNIEPGMKVMEDLTNKLNELITQSNDLDSRIKEAETKNDKASRDELDKLKTDKQNIENDIENIRLGSDFTNVTVILKRK